MYRIITFTLVFVVNTTIAHEKTYCISNNYQSKQYGYNGFNCQTSTTICKDVISSISLKYPRHSCTFSRYCDELIMSSPLTKIDDKLIDSEQLCNLIKLTINASMISYISNDAFYSFPSLLFLNLDNNQIKDLNFLQNLINLQSLSVEMNNLSEIDANDFKELGKLIMLNLAHNNIQTLGNSTYTLENLKELYLNNNNIRTIKPDLLSKLKRLQILNMANNEIAFIDRNLLNPLAQLRDVNFGNNRIQAITDWIFPNSIKTFYLQNNILKFSNTTAIRITSQMINFLDLSGSNVPTLGNIFTFVTSLNTLKMSNCSINEIEPFAFYSLKELVSLDLSKNNLKTLKANYFTGLQNMQQLNLEQNQIKIIFLQSFYELWSLAILNITVENFTLTNYTFKDLKWVNTLNFVDSNILTVSNGSFSANKDLTYINLKNTSLQHIEEGFSNTERLRCVSSMCENEDLNSTNVFNLSDISLRSINNYGFKDVNRRTNFIFDYNNVTIIPNYMFYNSKVNIISFNSSGIKHIEPNAFQNIADDYSCNNNYCETNDKTIFINNNNISIIQEHTFKDIINMHSLIMQNNSIQIIEEYAFEELQFVDVRNRKTYKIDLSHNLLSVIQNNTFYHITNVEQIVLNNNVIEKIIPGAFNAVVMCRKSTLTMQQNRLSRIAKNTFAGISHLTHLILNQNNITKIDKGAFNTLNETKYLNLSYNNLKVIEENIFVGLERLEILYLDNNKIETLMYNSFNNLVNLTALKLDNNQLKSIPLGTFRNIPSLNILELNENELAILETGIFTNIKHLKILNLANNNFSALDINVLFPLCQLENLYINNNSFSYIDYFSLNSHVPDLKYIGLNFNHFNCTFLTIMLQYFRSKAIRYNPPQDSIFHLHNGEGILCFKNESTFLIENEKPINKTNRLQSSILSININQNEKDLSNETKLENIMKNITNLLSSRNNFEEKESKEYMKNVTNLLNSIYNNSDSGFKVFISMIGFAILLLMLLKTFNKTYFYRLKAIMCKTRKPDMELIETSEN